MQGLPTGIMMDRPLLIRDIMQHAERTWPKQEIVSVMGDRSVSRKTYTEVFQRTRKLANALNHLGIKPGDTIATMAWNDHRHVEIYYAVACSGSICHTINPRLSNEQLAYIINDAQDSWLFLDPDFIPLLEKLQKDIPAVKGFIVLSSGNDCPETTLKNIKLYDPLLETGDETLHWPEFPETTASSLCYTSGTTGHPKGVLYSHRSTVLHTLMSNLNGVVGLSEIDVVMPVVPMFHVNAWGIPYSAAMAGAKLVLPGPFMGNGDLLQTLVEAEQVTVGFGVPTIWLALLQYLEESGKQVQSLKRIFTGGTACPRHVIATLLEKYGVDSVHLWGMTEMSPLGTLNQAEHRTELSNQERLDLRAKQGRAAFGIDMKLKDNDDQPVSHDGETPGRLFVRGYSVCSGYINTDSSYITHDEDGWLDTGDIATIDTEGYLHITDRAKDVIKSGGEWISSIALENLAMGHPHISEAAAIAIPHDKWGERPMIIAVRKDAASQIDENNLLDWYNDKVPDWWKPDKVVFVDELPHTATGKVMKSSLRKQWVE